MCIWNSIPWINMHIQLFLKINSWIIIEILNLKTILNRHLSYWIRRKYAFHKIETNDTNTIRRMHERCTNTKYTTRTGNIHNWKHAHTHTHGQHNGIEKQTFVSVDNCSKPNSQIATTPTGTKTMCTVRFCRCTRADCTRHRMGSKYVDLVNMSGI